MSGKTRPLFLASACLCGLVCRYDGRSAPLAELADLYEQGLALAVCPETDGGLPVPRTPCELVNGRAVTEQGRDVTEMFLAGAEKALGLARKHGIGLAVLKEKSPSCGSGLVYDGSFSRRLVPGRGLAAALLLSAGLVVVNELEYGPVVRELLMDKDK